MRETTIFRSDLVVAGVAVLALCAGTASAQDTLQTGQPAQQPRVHVVQQGETLWSLAQLYLGDPFLWPEIYRLNTLVVEDPHWIFPGEELLLAPRDVTAVADRLVEGRPGAAEDEQAVAVPIPVQPADPEPQVEMPPPVGAPPPPPPTEDVPSIFAPRGDAAGADASLARIRAPVYRYRPVREGEFYAAGFLTEGQSLPWARVLGAVGKPTLGNLRASSSAQLFGEIEVAPPPGAEYRVGDSLLVARVDRELTGDWGRVVIPTAIAEVTALTGNRVVAEVFRMFGRVSDGQMALPLEPFRDPGSVVPLPVEGGMEGLVIAPRDRNAVPGQQDILFINLGRQDGVALGDVFEIVRPDGAETGDPRWQRVAVVHVVHVRDRSASAVLLTINDLGADPGARVRLIRKMPS